MQGEDGEEAEKPNFEPSESELSPELSMELAMDLAQEEAKLVQALEACSNEGEIAPGLRLDRAGDSVSISAATSPLEGLGEGSIVFIHENNLRGISRNELIIGFHTDQKTRAQAEQAKKNDRAVFKNLWSKYKFGELGTEHEGQADKLAQIPRSNEDTRRNVMPELNFALGKHLKVVKENLTEEDFKRAKSAIEHLRESLAASQA